MKPDARGGKCEILVCFAVKEEARPFRKVAVENSRVSILVTGMGKKNARESVSRFLEGNSPVCVFTCGFAGALHPELKIGTVVFSTDDESLREQLISAKVVPAGLCCEDRIATCVEEKAHLRGTTGADAVEMESEAIQTLCRERRIPCATVRVISDAANEDLPLDFNKLLKPDMNINSGKLAWEIAKSPQKIPALMRLQKNCAFAADNLAKVLAAVIFR